MVAAPGDSDNHCGGAVMLDRGKLRDVLWLLEVREASRKAWVHLTDLGDKDSVVCRSHRQIITEIDAELELMLIEDTVFPE